MIKNSLYLSIFLLIPDTLEICCLPLITSYKKQIKSIKVML